MRFPDYRIFTLLLLTFFSSTYATEPQEDYLEIPIPENWQPEPQYYQTLPTEDAWWTTFNDPVLTQLIEKAVKNNYNVASALKRIEMAKKEIRITEAGYYPDISLSAGWTKTREAGAIGGNNSVKGIAERYFSLGAAMNWEIDVFGRIYAQAKEKKAAYNVSRADYDAVMVSLCANVATAYMQLRTYQEELRVTKQHIESQSYVCKITKARFNAELADMLDVTQANVVLYETQSTLPTLETSIRTMKNSIALLTGEYPGDLDDLLSDDKEMPDYLQTVATGIPSDLLRRRPDIVEAEMELAEYAAAIGVAKKDFLPTLSITGEIGTSSRDINGLFGKNSLTYSIAPQLSWTLFEGLARNYTVQETKLQLEAAIDQYNLTVMTAVEEVDNALASYAGYLNAIELQKRVVEESKKSMELSFELYRSGLTMFTNVVNGQISWLTSQNTLITLEGNALASLITLYQALGGGWETFRNKD